MPIRETLDHEKEEVHGDKWLWLLLNVIQLQMNVLKNDLLQIILAGIVVYVQH